MNDGRRRSAAARSAPGFTLLEVLAAVAILGLWYVVLASLAIQGLRAEGESARRLRASLLVDEIVADFETQLASGSAPALGSDEMERDGYQVRIEITPFELPSWLQDPGGTNAPAATGGRRGIASSLLRGHAGNPSPLRTIRVEVAWREGFEERHVRRTTFGFDLQAAGPLLKPLDKPLDPPAAGSGGTREEAAG